MKFLFFTNTPAHVHLYKHVVRDLEDRGHDVRILAREYTCTVELLEWHDLPYDVYGACGTTKGSLVSRLPAHYVRAIRLARRFDPDLIFGMGGYAAHTGAILRTPTVLLIDSEPAAFDHAISTPFARTVLTPNTFRKDLGEHHYVFDGLKECAYLHPDVYEPNPDVRDALDLGADEPFAILRLNAFGSQHDVGKQGITGTERRRIIEQLAEEVTVLVSDEGDTANLEGLPARSFELHPALLHDALSAADLLVADTQTMVTEAALLGTPAIRSNSFVGEDDMGNFVELEKRGLIRNVASPDAICDEIETLFSGGATGDVADGADTAVDDLYQRRRDEFLADTVSLSDLLVDVALVDGFVDELESVRQLGQHARPERSESMGVGSD